MGALLAVPLVVPVLPGTGTEARADPTDRRLGSWNMHGQFQREDDRTQAASRWQTSVLPRFDTADVLALQEAGSEPAGTRTERRFSQTTVSEHIWQTGGSDRTPDRTTANVYWADVGQQRNGLAFVTRETAVDAVTVDVGANSRPLLGVQIGNDWYFTGHARSRGGRPNDQVAMYNAARDFMNRRAPGSNWILMSDFNNPPSSIPVSLQSHVIMAGQPTHQGGRELDYWLMGDRNNGTLGLDRPGGQETSDHFYLRLVRELCRRDGTDCEAPLPGRAYRFEAKGRENHALALSYLPMVSRFDPAKDADSPKFRATVRFSDAPDARLLSYRGEAGDKCLVTKFHYIGSWFVDTATCDPADKAQQWHLTGDRIQNVRTGETAYGAEMQPDKGIVGNISMGQDPTYWRPVEVAAPELDDTADDDQFGNGDRDAPGGGNPGAGTDDRSDPGLGQAG